MNRRSRALMRADAGRMAADAALLWPLGGCMMLEFDHVHTQATEHVFTCFGQDHRDLDLLQALGTAMPDLRFADFWFGYLRYLCAEVELRREVTAP